LPNQIPLNVFGTHNLMNLNAAKLVCKELGISGNDFDLAISSFTGAAKRLELLHAINQTNVYKDFAHSPSKLKATIDAVKAQFSERKLIIFLYCIYSFYKSINKFLFIKFISFYKFCKFCSQNFLNPCF
jgi:UDP-N-acetylmuramate: L-alanyl-gamma-D-glutamyl-meso-diaminopimelate ligase